jgi:hypothetical protein
MTVCCGLLRSLCNDVVKLFDAALEVGNKQALAAAMLSSDESAGRGNMARSIMSDQKLSCKGPKDVKPMTMAHAVAIEL